VGIYRCALVAFDGSKYSKNALKQAIKFGEDTECRISAVTVLRTPEGEAEVVRAKNTSDGYGNSNGAVTVNSVKMIVDDRCEIQTILEEGIIHEAIIAAAEKRDCDLIIMGRRVLTKLERTFAGSFTARVIRYSPIDVLIMPRNTKLGWRTILFATDGSEFSDIATERVLDIAEAYGAELKILSVVNISDNFYNELPGSIERMIDHARENVEVAKQRAEERNIKVETFIREGEPYEKIVKLANELKADAVCMGCHGRTGLRRFIMGSVTEKVIEEAHCPVLVVKNNR
jgi:nucleotide-binding universal stress UspA family protein